MKKIIGWILPFVIIMMTLGITSCVKEENPEPRAQYGYVQFKLYKTGTAPQTKAVLDSLTMANKIRVELKKEGSKSSITQVLALHSYDSKTGEFGLRSEKMPLTPGEYVVKSFKLFNKVEEDIATNIIKAGNKFTIIGGGLVVEALETDTKGKGTVTFKVKNVIDPATKSESEKDTYPIKAIQTMDIKLQDLRSSSDVIELKKVAVEYKQDFREVPEGMYEGMHTDYPDNLIEYDYAECDTLLWLPAGNYRVVSFTTYSDRRAQSKLGTTEDCNITFLIEDNKETEPVDLIIGGSYQDENIKDYIALRELWVALGGNGDVDGDGVQETKPWSYFGESYPTGTNWSFDKDITMWGDQPGVRLDKNGRVASISLSGFGARGVIPEAIGQFTELTNFYIGTHSELTGNGGYDFTDVAGDGAEITYENGCPLGEHFLKVVADQDPRSGMSPELKDAFNDNLKPGVLPILEKKAVHLPEGYVPEYTNHITGISKALMRCAKLSSFSIANSPIRNLELLPLAKDSKYKEEEDSWSWSNFEEFTDIEIFNCPLLEQNPMTMLMEMPNLVSYVSAFNTGIEPDQFLKDWDDFARGSASREKVQALYLSFNRIQETPEYEALKNLKRLRLLDCSNNEIHTIHPFGPEISFAKLFFNNNQITKVPSIVVPGEDGKPDQHRFCGFYEVEAFTFANNKLTEFPDIFNADAMYVMGTVDFSGNQIDRLENGENHCGVNTNILNLSNNKFQKFPSRLFQAGSPIGFIILSHNGMEEIEKGSLVCESIGKYLTTLDLSYNKLEEIPAPDFLAANMPYLQGLDISYNRFDHLPFAPMNSAYLMILNLRHQRDENGNRIFRDWPKGVGKHHGLRRLFLGFNDIRVVDDTINPDIFIFDIKGNPNITIDMTNICPLIKRGMYKFFYDRTQDIRGCEELKEHYY